MTRQPTSLVNTTDSTGTPGVQWKLTDPARDLDANIVQLAPDAEIGVHIGAEVDVLLQILDGTGFLITESGSAALSAGDLLLLPRKSRRGFAAGPHGMRYLTVHQRRQSLTLGPIGGPQ